MAEVCSFSGWWMVLISYVPSGESLPEPRVAEVCSFSGWWMVLISYVPSGESLPGAPGWQRYAVSLVGGWC